MEQDEIVAQAEDDVATQITTDLAYTQREAMNQLATQAVIVGYWRVPSGSPCDFCELVADQLYHRDDLMPVHPGCECGVEPAFSDEVPGAEAVTEEPPPPEEAASEDRYLGWIDVTTIGTDAIQQEQADNINQALQDSFRGLDDSRIVNLNKVIVQKQLDDPRTHAMTGGDTIWIRSDVIRPTAARQKAEDGMKKSGWFVPTPATMDQQTMMHETGHYLFNQLRPNERGKLNKMLRDLTMPEEPKTTTWSTMAGKQVQTSTTQQMLQEKAIAQAVSRYGATSRHETMAEIWSEYKLSDQPREVAATIGKEWERMLTKPL